MTKVEFRYDAAGAHARVHVADLQPAGEFVFAVTNRTQSVRFGLAATGLADGSRTSTFYRFRDGAVSEDNCKGSKVRWSVAKDVVTMSFPQRCFRALDRKVVMAVGSTRDFPDGVDGRRRPGVGPQGAHRQGALTSWTARTTRPKRSPR